MILTKKSPLLIFCFAFSVIVFLFGSIREVKAGRAHLQGRVVKNDPAWQCKLEAPDVSRYYWGSSRCDPSWCYAGSGFDIFWRQPSRGVTSWQRLNSLECEETKPSYTSENTGSEPYADADGEEVFVRIVMSDPSVKLEHAFFETTYGNRVRCIEGHPIDFIFENPGPVQEVKLTIYDNGNGCNWNNLWFDQRLGPAGLSKECLPSGDKLKLSWIQPPQTTSFLVKLDYDYLTKKQGPNYQQFCVTAPYPFFPPPTISQEVNILPNTNYIGWAVASAWGNCSDQFGESGQAEDFRCVSVLPSCTISVDDITIPAGSTKKVLPSLTQNNGTVDEVEFEISNPDNVSVCDSSSSSCRQGQGNYTDRTSPFDANITAYLPGSTTLIITGRMQDEPGGPYSCSDTAQISVTNTLPWWQVVGGDAVVSQGNLVSKLPNLNVCPGCVFIADNPQGHPGVPSAGGETDFGEGRISSKGWVVEDSPYRGTEPFSYEYFEKKIPIGVELKNPGNQFEQEDVDDCEEFEGYCWFKYDGSDSGVDLTTSGRVIDAKKKKVVLFVKNSDFEIKSLLKVTRGLGGFYVIVEGDQDNGPAIRIDPLIGDNILDSNPDIEGIFFTERTFSTGTQGNGGDNQLYIRGSVFAKKFQLQRDLARNFTTPAEVFEFAPDLILNWPIFLSPKNIIWREVTP